MDTVMLSVHRVPGLQLEVDPKLFGGWDLAREFPKVMREGKHDEMLNSCAISLLIIPKCVCMCLKDEERN